MKFPMISGAALVLALSVTADELPAGAALSCSAAVRAIDFSDEAQRAAQPRFVRPSFACGVEDGEWADGRWCYRFRLLRQTQREECPSVTLAPTVKDWSGYDRFVIDVYNASTGGDMLRAWIAGPEGRLQSGLSAYPWQPLADYGIHRWVIELRKWPNAACVTERPVAVCRRRIFSGQVIFIVTGIASRASPVQSSIRLPTTRR